MRYSTLFSLATFLISGFSAACRNFEKKDCSWFGTVPFCGTSCASYGDIDDDGRQYITSTKDYTLATLEYYNQITEARKMITGKGVGVATRDCGAQARYKSAPRNNYH